jgi:hypothetical protein
MTKALTVREGLAAAADPTRVRRARESFMVMLNS